MKNISLVVFCIFGSKAIAEMVVTDPTTQAILQQQTAAEATQHSENITKWVESIEKLNTQINQYDQQIQQLNQLKTFVGDPAQAASLIGLDKLTSSLGQTSVGQTLQTLASSADGNASLNETFNGLYQAIPNTTASGTTVTRNSELYKSNSAVEKNRENLEKVYADTDGRIQELRKDLAETAEQMKNAKDQAEVQKLQAKMQATQAEIDTLLEQRRDAADQLIAQDISNRNQVEKEAKAKAEDSYAEMSSYNKNMTKAMQPQTKVLPDF